MHPHGEDPHEAGRGPHRSPRAQKRARQRQHARAQLTPKRLPLGARSFDVRMYARPAVIYQRKSGGFPGAQHLCEDDAAPGTLDVNALLHQAAFWALHPPVYRLASGPTAAHA
jgi:hypothetical protein